MGKRIKVVVGLDVHKDSIVMAVAEPDGGAGRVIGTLRHDVARLRKAPAKVGPASGVAVVYAAGPTGEDVHEMRLRLRREKSSGLFAWRPRADPRRWSEVASTTDR